MGRLPRLSLTTLALLVGLGLIAGVATFAHRHLSSLDGTEAWVEHSHDVLETAQTIEIAVTDATRAQRAYGATRDPAELERYRAAVARLAAAQHALGLLTRDDPGQQQRLDEIDRTVAARVAQLDLAVAARRAQALTLDQEVTLTNEGLGPSTRLAEQLAAFDAAERTLLAARVQAMHDESAFVRRTMVVGFGASVLILGMAFLLLRREVARRRRSEEALGERERRLAATLGSIGDGVIATDAAGRITQMNRVAEDLTGWSTARAAGRPFAEIFRIVDENTGAAEPDPVARVLAERVQVGLASPTVLIAQDGARRPIADSAAPIIDETGELRGVVVVFRDVSLTKASEERFRRLVDAAPDAIVIIDPDGRIAIVNDQARAMFGHAPAELIGQPVEVLIPERLRDRHVDHRRGFHASPTVRAMGTGLQLVAQRKDGSLLPVEVSLSPLETPDGIQVIAAVRDVQRRRDLERFRDEYVGFVSHDLKNPLSVITLQARVLARSLDRDGSAEARHAIEVIAANAALIDRLVRELLEMAYVESDQIQLETEPIELAPFLRAVVARTVSTSDHERVQVEIDAPATVVAESRRIERVVANFVQNAIKYAPAGSPIRVRLTVDGGCAVVSVIDQGPGLSPDERRFVFDKYRRAASAKQQDGLGLGLYISRKIVEAHGGEIGVDSEPGRGATFYMRLPRSVATVHAELAAPVAAPAPTGRLRGVKVLLVDDQVTALSALAALLEDEGLDVQAADSGEQALVLAASRAPDVAVIDVQMPGMSGLTLLERLRADRPGLPVVIMTGHLPSDAGIAEARAASGAAYVGKPVDVDELLRALTRVASG